MNEYKLLIKGTSGALLEYESPTKYELVSAWCYDEKTNSWGQGHYFTLWYNDITEKNKAELKRKAINHFKKNYL